MVNLVRNKKGSIFFGKIMFFVFFVLVFLLSISLSVKR